MYPLYWTPSRGGIIMRYTYEYKRKCVELYREGKWPETPEGVSDKSFRDKVRLWVRAEDSRGPEALKHKNFNRNWTPEERLELVSQVMSGKSCVSVAIEAGIQDRLLYQWVQNYKTKGYNGLVEMKKGRPSKGVPQMKKEEARPLNDNPVVSATLINSASLLHDIINKVHADAKSTVFLSILLKFELFIN